MKASDNVIIVIYRQQHGDILKYTDNLNMKAFYIHVTIVIIKRKDRTVLRFTNSLNTKEYNTHAISVTFT